MSLLDELRGDGLEFRLAGGQLQFRPTPTGSTAQRIKSQEAELVCLLKAEQPAHPTTLSQALGGIEESSPCLTVRDVAALPLARFATSRLVLEVRSDALGEVVLLASDDALIDPGETRTIYRAAELLELLGLSADSLREVHQIKRTFGGSVVPS